MKTIATLQRVRQAQEEMRLGGVTNPSADAIIAHIGGGSKQTVLTHMRALAAEEARSPAAPDVPLELLRSSADVMARRLWEQARTMADAMHASHHQVLVAAHDTRLAQLQDAADVEAGLRAELAAARATIADLEQQLRQRATAEEQLASVVEMLQVKVGPVHPPIVQLLRLLDAERPRTRADLFQLMVETGHTRDQARTALSEARKRGYAEGDDDGVRLADAGASRLANGRRRA